MKGLAADESCMVSEETCVAYRNAYQEYIDALKPNLNFHAWTPDHSVINRLFLSSSI